MPLSSKSVIAFLLLVAGAALLTLGVLGSPVLMGALLAALAAAQEGIHTVISAIGTGPEVYAVGGALLMLVALVLMRAGGKRASATRPRKS